ncbi:hypothetical protein DFH27DRAFT_16162 [Peziza echinospora]|nr:hypothetical protein DFH27DRAFT_16162 [Peziza echinospora]
MITDMPQHPSRTAAAPPGGGAKSNRPLIDRTEFLFPAGVVHGPMFARSPSQLPLDVLSFVLAYIDSPADLARISRVSRILHYLATPLLYREVRLRGGGPKPQTSAGALGKRKRADEDGDGDGGAGDGRHGDSHCAGISVFLAGLATLQRPTVSRVVRKLVFEGSLETSSFRVIDDPRHGERQDQLVWTEADGMFGLAVGATANALTDLQELSWGLRNAHVHPLLWYSLSRHPELRKLTYICPPPWLDGPAPTTYVPMFQHLTSLSVLGIDGRSPPDDFSRAVFGGLGRIRELRLSWADAGYEHQRDAGPGGGLRFVFAGRVRSLEAAAAAETPQIPRLALRKLELMNLYLPPGDRTLDVLLDPVPLEALSLLNCSVFQSWASIFPPASDASSGPATPATASSSSPTPARPPSPTPNLRFLRTESLSPSILALLNTHTNLHHLYLLHGPSYPSVPVPASTRQSFIDAIARNHAKTLTHLHLPCHCIATKTESTRLIRACRHSLREFAIATEKTHWGYLAVLIPFMQVHAFHLLRSPHLQLLNSPMSGLFGGTGPEIERMERRMADQCFNRLRLLGVGEQLWRVDSVVSVEQKKPVWEGGGGMDGANEKLPSALSEGEALEKQIPMEYVKGERDEMEWIEMQLEGSIEKRKTVKSSAEDLNEFGIVREARWGLFP